MNLSLFTIHFIISVCQ